MSKGSLILLIKDLSDGLPQKIVVFFNI